MTLILQWVRSYITFPIRLESGGVIRSIIDAIAFPTMEFKIINCKGDSSEIISKMYGLANVHTTWGRTFP